MREMNKKKEMHVWAVVFSALILLTQHRLQSQVAAEGFIRAKGLNFVLNRNKFLANGFNAYWLMMLGSDPSQKSKVTSAFREASGHGLSVGRTWAFSDGGSNPLQYSPGSYNENMFKVYASQIYDNKKNSYFVDLVMFLWFL